MPKIIKVLVSTVDTDLEFTIQSSTTGKQLFDKVVRAIGLREAWYFGLLFFDSNKLPDWIDLAKKVKSQVMKKEDPLRLKFLAKYFPEDAAEELILPLTKKLFFLQVRDSILNDECHSPAETAVLLASYSLQATHDDYDPAVHNAAFFEKEKLLPKRVIKQHTFTKAEWDDKIIRWYAEHKGVERETAMVEYLKVAQDLDMYGISYFDIKNKKGSELSLGVDALGINVYDKSDNLTPKIGFPWAEVNKVSYSGKKFIVKPTDKNSPNFVFLASNSSVNKKIIGLSKGNYELFSRRRKPDTIELQQMKTQVREEQEFKERQRLMLSKEKEHRAVVEGEKRLLEGQLDDYRRKVDMSYEDLQRSQRTSEELRLKLEELEAKREELERSQVIAYEARKLAEEAVHAEKAERLLKEEQAAEAQEMLERKMREAVEKEEEARQLQDELVRARREIENHQINSLKVIENHQINSHMVETTTSRNFVNNNTTEPAPYFIPEMFRSKEGGGSSRDSSVGVVNEFTYVKELRQLDSAIGAGSEHTFVEDSKTPDHESHEFEQSFTRAEMDAERMTVAEKNLKLGNQLKSLQRELEESRMAAEMTQNDQIYTKNVKQGRDKYKTLKQIRQGNTKIRIETFESL